MGSVLVIGNSFSQDAFSYLEDMVRADASSSREATGSGSAASDADFRVANLYIGGCSLRRHWSNACSGEPAYELYEFAAEPRFVSLAEAIEASEWDAVVMQQVSHESGFYETYQPFLADLAAWVRERRPSAELLIHQTWAYAADSEHPGFVRYGNDQARMFAALKAAYDQAAASLNARILPSGDAWQRARGTAIGDALCRDGFHGNEKGRYLSGCVWYGALSGKDLFVNGFVPEGLEPRDARILKECATAALAAYGWR